MRAPGRLKSLGGEALWVVLGRVLAMCGQIASLKFLAAFLSVEEYGRLGLILAIAYAGSLFLFSPFGHGVLRFTQPMLEDGDHDGVIALFRRTLPRLIGAAFLAGLVIITIFARIQDSFGFLPLFYALVILALQGFQVCSFNALMAMRARKVTAVSQILTGLSRGLIAAPLVLLVGGVAETVLIGIICFMVALDWLQYRFLVREVNARRHVLTAKGAEGRDETGSRTTLRDIYRYSSPFVLFYILDSIVLYADRYVAFNQLTLTDVGIIVAFQQVARAMSTFIVGSSMQLIFPIIFGRAGKRNDAQNSKDFSMRISLFNYAGIVTTLSIIVGLSWAFSDAIVLLLLDEKYVFAAAMLPWFVAAHSVSDAARALNAVGFASYKAHIYLLPKIMQAALYVTMMLWLVPAHGTIGVAWSLLAASIMWTLGCLWANRLSS